MSGCGQHCSELRHTWCVCHLSCSESSHSPLCDKRRKAQGMLSLAVRSFRKNSLLSSTTWKDFIKNEPGCSHGIPRTRWGAKITRTQRNKSFLWTAITTETEGQWGSGLSMLSPNPWATWPAFGVVLGWSSGWTTSRGLFQPKPLLEPVTYRKFNIT